MIDGTGVFLHPENPSSLGDDTFWTWFKREFPASRWDWENAKAGDVVLQYSALGKYEGQAKYIALCWELYPEMQEKLPRDVGDWSNQVAKCMECAEHTPWRTVPTEATKHYYRRFGHVEVLPIGIDSELFRPLGRKAELRKQYGVPNGEVGFWCGTKHRMKGHDLMEDYRRKNPGIFWVLCWKEQSIPQHELAELMNCADFVLGTGRLTPMFMVEWEAMSAGLPLRSLTERELPDGSTRSTVLGLGWARLIARNGWSRYIQSVLEA